MDIQPCPTSGGFIVLLSGQLVMDLTSKFAFSQVFQVLGNGKGGYYCHNDILRLIY